MIQSLQKIKDIHKGKTILVCGSGGSLLDIDIKKLHPNIIVMCCNSATYHLRNLTMECLPMEQQTIQTGI